MNLSYELCLELKESGYPQKITEDFYREGRDECKAGNPEVFFGGPSATFRHAKAVKIPSVSEVLEECRQLAKPEAIAIVFRPHGIVVEIKGRDDTKIQPTFDEAVVRLYSSLTR